MSSSKATDPIDASDDLDDLDDILDEFNESKSKQQPSESRDTPTTSSSIIPPQANTAASTTTTTDPSTLQGANDGAEETEEEMNERFARELAVGMEALMKGLGGTEGSGEQPDFSKLDSSSEKSATGNENSFNEDEMMKQFEQMMADMGLGGMAGMDGFPGATSSSSSSGGKAVSIPPLTSGSSQAAPPPANFQDAIKSTMSRLRESDASASTSADATDGMDLEKLMAALGGSGEGLEGEEGLAKMLESMMGELMSKEILYDPLKELRDKYPAYLANPPTTLSNEDRNRYQAQFRIVTQVISIFDDKKFDTGTEVEKSALKAKVQTLINEMQDNGSPPAEIVGDLPPELENMPGLGNDENCSIM